jgi:hypothetical protein
VERDEGLLPRNTDEPKKKLRNCVKSLKRKPGGAILIRGKLSPPSARGNEIMPFPVID